MITWAPIPLGSRMTRKRRQPVTLLFLSASLVAALALPHAAGAQAAAADQFVRGWAKAVSPGASDGSPWGPTGSSVRHALGSLGPAADGPSAGLRPAQRASLARLHSGLRIHLVRGPGRIALDTQLWTKVRILLGVGLSVERSSPLAQIAGRRMLERMIPRLKDAGRVYRLGFQYPF